MSVWESVRFGVHTIGLQCRAATSERVVRRIQKRRLKALLTYARLNSPYYHDKFLSVSSDAKLQDLPVSSKNELMTNFDRSLTVTDISRAKAAQYVEDGANLGGYFCGKYAVSHTSGSQGQPLLLIQPKDNLELLFELQASRGNRTPVGPREAVRRFLNPARVAAVTLKPGFYPSATAFQHVPKGAEAYIKFLQLSISDADVYLRLQEYRPTHLTAYASVLNEIALQIEQGHLSLQGNLEQVINISERLLPSARARYEQIFGVPVFDDYAMGECLFLSNGCQTTGGMHVNSDWAILEVVDAENRPVPDGTAGSKVLVTNLANYVQPIIRYEIGDIVTMSTESCGCGNNRPLIASVQGRDSDVFYVESELGQRPVPLLMFEFVFNQILDAREYQVIQECDNLFRMRIEPLDKACFDITKAKRLLREQLGVFNLGTLLTVELEVVHRLQQVGDSKFRRAVSNGPPNLK